MTTPTPLPLVDEHAVDVDAAADRVWTALGAALDGAFGGGLSSAYARLVGCDPATTSGPRPLAVGSTVPGFRVRSVVPGRELVLEGRHRFSDYLLTFRLDDLPDLDPARTRLRAESRAAFPGLGGAGYRALVIGTRLHVVGVRRLLAGVRRAAAAASDEVRP